MLDQESFRLVRNDEIEGPAVAFSDPIRDPAEKIVVPTVAGRGKENPDARGGGGHGTLGDGQMVAFWKSELSNFIPAL